jgi:hypothetical protein
MIVLLLLHKPLYAIGFNFDSLNHSAIYKLKLNYH